MKHRILFAALLCLPLCLMAHKDDKNPKYLLGAVPEVNGIVTFQKNFSVTDKNEQQIYDVLLAHINNPLISDAIHDKSVPYTRIISEEKGEGTIVARIEEYMTFKRIPIISLDRTRFRYMLSAEVKGQKVSLTITQISYYYNEDMDGKNGVNKKGTKLYPKSGKFRRLTVDRVEAIFAGFMDAFATKKGVVEE